MTKTRSLEIHTVIVRGDFESFKAAFARSLLGVTFKKFKRKGRSFYQHRVHNEKVTQSVCSFLYQYLLEKTRNISNYELKTDLTVHWDDTGRILKISDIMVTLFLRAAELNVNEIKVQKKVESIAIDFFYSDIDAASQKLKDKISEIMDSMGKENFEYNEWNILEEKGKEVSGEYGVRLVPTIIINANPDLMLENPSERLLRNEIEDLYVPSIDESVPRFERYEKVKSAVQSLFATT